MLRALTFTSNHINMPARTCEINKRKLRHKRNNKTSTPYNNSQPTETSFAHSELNYKYKTKKKQNKTSPLRLTHLYTILTHSHATCYSKLQTSIHRHTSLNTPRELKQYTTTTPPTHSRTSLHAQRRKSTPNNTRHTHNNQLITQRQT